MTYGLNDRVREQVSAFAGGTGAVTLPVSAVSGCQTFLSGWGASGTGEYCLVIGAQWETGFGTLNAGGTTLTRTTTYNGSSGSGVAVNFNAGTMDCFGDIPAELAQHLNMREITVASATTCDIGAVAGSNIVVSGTVTITGLGTKANRRRYVRFSGALTLTHNGTSLILPGALNIVTVAGDTGIFQSDSSGNWRCVSLQRGANRNTSSVVLQTFTSSGTYTPTPGMTYCIIECVGGGGGGGGVANPGATATNSAQGGGSGGYSRTRSTAATIGASQVVTIGAAGAAGASGANAGGTGGGTSVGALCIAAGGVGGSSATGAPGAGGAAGTGDFASPGSPGGYAFSSSNSGSTALTAPYGPGGGSSIFGGGANALVTGGATAGNAATGYGGGGGGAASINASGAAAGGAGFKGVVIITEFVA